MSKETKTLVNYQIEKSINTLREAQVMVDNELWSGAANRAYYSCFYIVSAALLSQGMHSKTHKGVKSLFNEHFVKTELIPKDQGKFYSQIFNIRQQSDYDFFIEIEPQNVKDLIESAKNFISIVKEQINRLFLSKPPSN